MLDRQCITNAEKLSYRLDGEKGAKMTVAELIKMLSALEKQDQEVYLRGNDLFMVPVRAVTECSGNGTDYVLDDGEPVSQEQAVKALLEHRDKADKIKADIEIKAVQTAMLILKNSYNKENGDIKLDKVHWSHLRSFLCLMSACRKAVIDNFPLKNYVLTEIPSVEEEYMIMYFDEPGGYRTAQNYDPNAYEIVFQCFYGKPVAIPLRMINNGRGDEMTERENCFEAAQRCGEI